MPAKPLPCPTLLRLFLRYDPVTGLLTWRPRSRIWFKNGSAHKAWNTRFSGSVAFQARDGERYLTGTFLGQKLATHRVVWAISEGKWPDVVDHIDGNGRNNMIGNLRSVTASENQKNARRSVSNTSGYAGVRFCLSTGRWIMQIRCGGGKRVSRSFKSRSAALRSYERWKKRLGYHENHGKDRL